MSSSSSQPATDLREAYRVCDVKPLEGDDLDRYYVELGEARKSEAAINISTMLDLQEEQEFSTILFTGQRGCGKSTELRLLERNWRSQYHVIYLETDQLIDINDIEYTDLYLLVAQYVEYELRKLGIQLNRSILKDFEDWFRDITQETEKSVESSISLESEVTLGDKSPLLIPFLAKLLAKLTSQIKGSPHGKIYIRNVLKKDTSKLKFIINLLLDDATQKIRRQRPECKGILFIFDNLDRCSPYVASNLFIDHASQLQDLRATVIYTVPIASVYSSQGIANSFNKPSILPTVNIYEFKTGQSQLNHNLQGINTLVSLIAKRMDIKKIFAIEEVLLELIRASGGHIRQLIQMVREACVTARGRGHESIQMEDVKHIIKQHQVTFERVISEQHYSTLAYIYVFKKFSTDDIGQILIANLSVLEYSEEKLWYYPHPTVIQIDSFQRALKNLKSKLSKIKKRLSNNKSLLHNKPMSQVWRNLLISEIELINIRCFEHLNISLIEDDSISKWLMILGNNAAGKTTLLRSVALGISNPSDASAIIQSLSGGFVRQGTDKGSIKIVLRDVSKTKTPLLMPQRLYRALLNAFPTTFKLSELRNSLNTDLATISPYQGLDEQVEELIMWAEKAIKYDELIAAARRINPKNDSLKHVYQEEHTDTYTITTTIIRQSEDSEIVTQEIEPEIDFLWSDIFVCGYGVNRPNQIGINPEGYRTLDAVQSLFTSQVSFQDPEVVLRRRSIKVRKQIEQQLLKVMMLDDHADYQFHYSDRGIEVDGPWGRQPLAALSDGYRSTSQWLLDFIGWAVHANRLTENGSIGGILLIDEIEQHLHPLWQRYFVQRLHEMFPNTQIIASTHTPLAASGVADIESGLLVKLDRSPENGVQAKLINKEELYGKRADQVLTSEAFGLVTSRNLGSLTDIDRYSELLGRTKRSQEEESELQKLRDKLRESLQDGENATERLIRKEVTAAIERASNDITPELLELEITKHLRQISNREV
jgi:predicted ATPase